MLLTVLTIGFLIQFTVKKPLQNDEYAVIIEEGEEAHWEVRRNLSLSFFCWAGEQLKPLHIYLSTADVREP
jgi:hypothetical protein